MPDTQSAERPLGLYFVALYFVLAGFLESIKTYFEWNAPTLSLNPMADHSVWTLTVHIVLHLVIAYLLWNFVALGRLAALVYGYIHVVMYPGIAITYLVSDQPLNVTPLLVSLGVFHVTALIPVIAYLQPARQKRVFHVSLFDLLFSNE